MPFEVKKKEFIPAIGVVEFGSEPTLALGGEKVWPLYGFDGPIANPPRVGVEIPISAPRPNSPPSVNLVEALAYTAAESTSRKKRLITS